jgi:hypothetical protein
MIKSAYVPQSAQEKDLFMGRIATIRVLLGSKNWLIGGYFNIILTLKENTGGTKRLDQDSGKL